MFGHFFDRIENQGYAAYDTKMSIAILVRELLQLHYELAYDVSQHPDEYTTEQIIKQTKIAFGLQKYFQEFTGETYIFEVPCARQDDTCNMRRQGDRGRNHCHPFQLECPKGFNDLYEEGTELRKQCITLGIDPSLGIERDFEKRIAILKDRIAAHFERQVCYYVLIRVTTCVRYIPL